jgi:hypothetical protein
VEQGIFQLDPFALLVVEAVIVEVEAITAVGLGSVHGGIGVLNQSLWGVAIFGIDGDPDTGRYPELLHADTEDGDQRSLKAHDELLDTVARLDVAQHDHEFIATDTCERALGAHRLSQSFSEAAQQHVTLMMPKRVVYVLEAVKIHEQHRQ